jgi:hypothetical protein
MSLDITELINQKSKMAHLKPAQSADFNVVIHANNGESFTVATSSQRLKQNH